VQSPTFGFRLFPFFSLDMATAADVAALNAKISALQDTVSGLKHSRALSSDYLSTGDADSLFLVLCGILVFFMQAGFALLEAGTVRAKNAKNILMKNLLDACIGAIIWWAWGYGIAYNGGGSAGPKGNGFIGHADGNTLGSFFTGDYNNLDNGKAYAGWWFQYVFAAAAATIVSGAMAERTTLIGYLVYTTFITGFIYPVVVYWTWGYGWASTWNGGLVDFAGSGIVHMTGGIAALCGAAIVGPRKGRFDESKKPIPMPAHNTTFQVLGTFILWLGWYGFNPGSTLAIAGQGQTMARAVCTTTLAAATGGITVVLLTYMMGGTEKTWDVGALCNGILAGLVSITAGAADVYPWAAVIIGMLGGFVYVASSKIVLNVCKVDDPLDAFSVHGACGFWGVIFSSFMAAPAFGATGAFYGDGSHFVASLAFLFADIGWTGGLSAMMFVPLKMAGLLRVSAEIEEAGMDVSKHGGSAYNQ